MGRTVWPFEVPVWEDSMGGDLRGLVVRLDFLVVILVLGVPIVRIIRFLVRGRAFLSGTEVGC